MREERGRDGSICFLFSEFLHQLQRLYQTFSVAFEKSFLFTCF